MCVWVGGDFDRSCQGDSNCSYPVQKQSGSNANSCVYGVGGDFDRSCQGDSNCSYPVQKQTGSNANSCVYGWVVILIAPAMVTPTVASRFRSSLVQMQIHVCMGGW